MKQMTELEKIAYAKTFLDKLANGINPLDDMPIPDGDIVNNIRISRCFFYVSDILRQVYENGGVQPEITPKIRKKEFSLTAEEHMMLQISSQSIPVSEIAECLNKVINQETTKRITAASINKWLVDIGLLENINLSGGKNRKVPTLVGKENGIFCEERVGQFGKYITVLFSPEAQRFVYDNIDAIIGAKEERMTQPKEKNGKYGSAWYPEEDEYLISLFKSGMSPSDIAVKMTRTEGGVRSRLKRLGLLENRYDEL